MLERSTGSRGPWYQRFGLGVASTGMGFITLIAAFWLIFASDGEITEIPDLRVTLPLFVLAVGAGIASFVRRERLRVLPVAGIAMATAALFIGWLVIVAAVAAAAIIAILVIAKFT